MKPANNVFYIANCFKLKKNGEQGLKEYTLKIWRTKFHVGKSLIKELVVF